MPIESTSNTDLNPVTLAKEIAKGNRTALARAITLIESKNSDHRKNARNLVQELLPLTGKARRVGITGVPGVGKSTFIDQIGTNLTNSGFKTAVLTVDPSSNRTGGSILGDKTRMSRLSTNPDAFIRPSPSSGHLGGVAAKTRETMMLCEAAGFDVVLIETVGIGQSETTVADMVDFFLVLMQPGAGDELQGIKKGVLEIADMIAVNKADGDGVVQAESTASDYRTALNILAPKSQLWSPPVMAVSGLNNHNLDELWNRMEEHRRIMQESGEFDRRRKSQQVSWMWSLLREQSMERLKNHPGLKDMLPAIEQEVKDGKLAASMAVERILNILNR